MGYSNLKLAICGLLLPAMAVSQDVVTVSIATCLPGLDSISSMGPGPSGLSAGSSLTPTPPESSSSVSVTSTPSSTPTGFLIAFSAPGPSRLLRRAVEMYPTLDGESTSACVHSPLFNVNPAGQLSVVNAGKSMTYSTSSGVRSAPFAPSSSVGNISTAWQLTDGTLLWKNVEFNNGTASLCTDATGTVQAYFLDPIPDDCTPISLSQTPVSTCPEYFVANPNGQLAPFTPSPVIPPSSTGVATGQSLGPTGSQIPPISVSVSETIGSPVIGSPSTGLVTGVTTSPAGLGNATSVVTSQSTGPSSLSSSNAPSVASSGSSLVSPSISIAPTSVFSISTSTSSGVVDSASAPSSPGVPSSISSVSSIGTSPVTSSSSVSNSSSSVPTGLTTAPSSSPSGSTSSSSSTGPSSSPSASSIPTSSSPTSPSATSPSVGQVTITSTIVSGSSLQTTFLNTASPTVIEEIVQPTTITTTIYSGSIAYTSTTTLAGGQPEVVVGGPATTTTTSYIATTTTATTTTSVGTNGQTTVKVIEPSPGMQYFGFVGNTSNYATPDKPDPAKYANNASLIDIKGVFPDNINFYTNTDGTYEFPGQTTEKNVSNYVVVFEGYLYGPAGPYAVTLTKATDDYSFLFCTTTDTPPKQPYSGWSDDSACITESIAGQYTQTHYFNLTDGGFEPFTIMWFNVYIAGGVRFDITLPNGTTVNDTTGFFVQPYPTDAFEYHLS